MAGEPHDVDATMDPATLYREEVFTDRRVGTIRVLTPVTAAGLPDSGRRLLYVGETQVLTAGGMLPIAFEIEAASLAEAVERFPAGVKAAVEQTIREIQELRREAASSIVIPDLRPGAPGAPPRGGIIHRP
jgi:hypothetical protein